MIAANPSAVYVADPRGVLQLSGSAAENEQMWSDVPDSWYPGGAGTAGLSCAGRGESLVLRRGFW
ncbi:hypothetical protein I553_0226 [Mycobacterium xenopi 4042]|uniref:Uncharacterized protein n=1 Tax=Mycobacterium xenopi 4042 TaxID=1299334 RepID=X7YJ98_MYCXE|nr:hypothetical protein I553_0226 [Mycobacterium xenopi 4042]